jgi:MYXO-CTERM domain-containing protein
MLQAWARRSRRQWAAFAGLLATLGATASGRAAGADGCTSAPSITTLPYSDSSATTCGLSNDVDNTGPATCHDLASSYPGPDAFYRIDLGTGNSIAIDLELASSATGDLAVFLVQLPGCSAASAAAVCAASSIDVMGAGQGPERIKAHGYSPGAYYIVVDSVHAVGTSEACGAYSLSVTGSLGTLSNGGAGGAGGAGGGSPSGGDASGGLGAEAGSTGGDGVMGEAGQGENIGLTGSSGDANASAGAMANGGAEPNSDVPAEAGAANSGQHAGSGASAPSNGCGCSTAGSRPASHGAGALAFAALGIALARRKRRRR